MALHDPHERGHVHRLGSRLLQKRQGRPPRDLCVRVTAKDPQVRALQEGIKRTHAHPLRKRNVSVMFESSSASTPLVRRPRHPRKSASGDKHTQPAAAVPARACRPGWRQSVAGWR